MQLSYVQYLTHSQMHTHQCYHTAQFSSPCSERTGHTRTLVIFIKLTRKGEGFSKYSARVAESLRPLERLPIC